MNERQLQRHTHVLCGEVTVFKGKESKDGIVLTDGLLTRV